MSILKKLRIVILAALLTFPTTVWTQDSLSNEANFTEKPKKIKLSGYLKDLVSISIPSWEEDWYFDNLGHNRLNFEWGISGDLTMTISGRNRLFFGNNVQFNPEFEQQITTALDFWQLDWIISQNNSYFLYSNIDRAYLTLRKRRYTLAVGKQRINWGKSYVWNPNDIFNAYSFFDFDYEERRGTNAVLFKYLTSPSSSLELASDVNNSFDSLTFAAKYNFSRWEYDFHVLSGKYLTDYFLGFGWAGQIKSAGIKGEVTYFEPYKPDNDDSQLVADISLDYTFPSTLALRFEGIFNSNPTEGGGQNILLAPATAKTLTFNHWSVFGSVSYDITPLIIFNLNSIYYIDDQSFFINPNLTISLNKNTEFLLASQIFNGSKNSTFGSLGSFVFTRLKWSF